MKVDNGNYMISVKNMQLSGENAFKTFFRNNRNNNYNSPLASKDDRSIKPNSIKGNLFRNTSRSLRLKAYLENSQRKQKIQNGKKQIRDNKDNSTLYSNENENNRSTSTNKINSDLSIEKQHSEKGKDSEANVNRSSQENNNIRNSNNKANIDFNKITLKSNCTVTDFRKNKNNNNNSSSNINMNHNNPKNFELICHSICNSVCKFNF